VITREKLGYAPGTMDAVYLAQDLDELDAALGMNGGGGGLLRRSEEIEAEARRLAMPELVAKARLQRARVLMASGRPREAIQPLTEARQALGNLRQHDLAVSVYAALAAAQAELRDWRAASEACDAGLELVEAHRYSVSGQYLQSAYLRSRIGLYSVGVRAGFETGEHERMLLRAELSKCRSVLRVRRRGSAPSAGEKKTERAFRTACEEIDEARAEARGDEALQALLAKRRNLWDLLLIERSGSGEDGLPHFRLQDVRAALADDEAALYYYWAGDRDLAIAAIAKDELAVEMAKVSREQSEQLRKCARLLLAASDPTKPEFADCLNELDRLAGVLLPAAIADALRRKSRLLISPHRMLHAVPFHALAWDGGYLIQRFAVTYVPNLTCLLARHAAAEGRRLLAIGIAECQPQPGVSLKPLKHAEEEVTELGRLYSAPGASATVLRGPEVVESRLRRLERDGQLQGFATLHVATHGLNVSEDTPMESHLYLYNSLLDGLDIANWKLRADLVVLSACCSGQRAIAGRGMAELPGDDLFGLQAAFFAAGARQVLGALWPVQSKVACGLMTAFHRFLLGGQSSERALQSTIVEHLETAGPVSRKRIYWAPFFLCAAGRSGGNSS
jgi:CHAT domain-containing protein